MAYDEALAARIRAAVGDQPGLTEQKMFGGLGFLLGGTMAVAASSRGGVLARVDPDEAPELLRTTPAAPMEMGGRTMTGWLHLDGTDVASDDALEEWVHRGIAYAAALPPKVR